MRITLSGPAGGRCAAPVAARIPMQRIDDDRMMALVDEDTGRALPVQMDSRARLCWIEQDLIEGETRRYRVDSSGFLADVSRVVVREGDADVADILQEGQLVGCYQSLADAQRPFLCSVLSPAGHAVTVDAPRGAAGACASAQHHSCWCGWKDVNGVDHWTDAPSSGRQRHRRFTLTSSGPVFGRVSALIDWLDPAGNLQFVEQRVFTIYTQIRGYRLIDVVSRFIMCAGPVTFGDTAEGGLCAVRVARELAPTGGGMLRNANREEGEEDCRGAAATWCDFTGQIDDRFVGVTMIDCPSNIKYPTLWNVSADGLLAANPFGLAGFLGDPKVASARTFESGSTEMFRYRLVVHDNSPTPEEIDRWSDSYSKSVEIVVD